MSNLITYTYHHAFKNFWFFHTLKKNIKFIADNPKLTNEEKGNRIYYHVFWQTWHICGEPVISNNLGSIINIADYMFGVLHKLNWYEPKAIKEKENQFQEHETGFGIGLMAQIVDFNLTLWHFGTDNNIKYCWNKAFVD